jgi:hypothetical protein
MRSLTRSEMLIPWECPRCGAPANGHGKGGRDECKSGGRKECQGFICECDDSESTCGTFEHPCPNAVCHHCGWSGTFPRPPRHAKPWERRALASGWTPPKGWG